MKVDIKKLTYICGFLGPAILILGSLITAIPYHDKRGEPYSILNHYISKLGEVGVSRLAPVFNDSLIIGGLVLVIFVLGLGLYIHTKLGYIATAFGIFSCISCSLVGVFPMNNLSIHNAVAFAFIFSGFVGIALFNLVIIFDKQNKVSKWLLIPGIITVVSLASSLVIPYITGSPHVQTFHPHRFTRLHVRVKTILEWSVFFTLIAWLVLMSIHLMTKRVTKAAKTAVIGSFKVQKYDSETMEKIEG